MDGALPALGCGDEVEAPLRMREPERYRDTGAWQYADYLLGQGMGVRASVHAGKVRVLGREEGLGRGVKRILRFAKDDSNSGGGGGRSLDFARDDSFFSARLRPEARFGPGAWGCWVQAAQGWASGRVLGYARSRANRSLPRGVRMTADDAGMLNAMLFGDPAGLNHGLRLGFERTGSFHLFVVSGMHVALVAGGIFWMLRRLRMGETATTLGTVVLTAGYAVLTGFGAPVAAGAVDDGNLSGGAAAEPGAECAECAGGGGDGGAGVVAGGAV